MGFLSRLFGGSQEQRSSIPAYLEEGGQQAVDLARQVGGIGFIPYRGPDVAAMTPMEQAAAQSTSQMAGAFGMPTGGGAYLPKAQRGAGGTRGYSSAPGFDAAVEAFRRSSPEQYNALMGIVQGLRGNAGAATSQDGAGSGGSAPRMSDRDRLVAMMTNAPVSREAFRASVGTGDTADNSRGAVTATAAGRYTGLADMLNGGGPGARGERGGALGFAGRAIGGGLTGGLGGAIAGGLGYNDVGDMFDGGGPGASGNRRNRGAR